MGWGYWIAWALAVGGFVTAAVVVILRSRQLHKDKAEHDKMLERLHRFESAHNSRLPEDQRTPLTPGLDTYKARPPGQLLAGWLPQELTMLVGALLGFGGLIYALVTLRP